MARTGQIRLRNSYYIGISLVIWIGEIDDGFVSTTTLIDDLVASWNRWKINDGLVYNPLSTQTSGTFSKQSPSVFRGTKFICGEKILKVSCVTPLASNTTKLAGSSKGAQFIQLQSRKISRLIS